MSFEIYLLNSNQAMGLAGSHVLGGEEALRSLSSNRICGVWWGLIIAVFSVMVGSCRARRR